MPVSAIPSLSMLSLYNTLTRKKEPFAPLKKNTVGLYTCGPTVYNFAHIGNLRTYIFEDILKRVLIYNGFRVRHVMNITDVGHLTSDADEGEDKMKKGAAREGMNAWQIARKYTLQFKQDLKSLNILPPDVMPRATGHIKEQIALISALEKKGYTYRTNDGIYFNTAKFKPYGALAGQNLFEKSAGARVAINAEKRRPWDFALWKFSPEQSAASSRRQMEWKSPWGIGFPGWHIECSAMARAYLGQPFDIHCGGVDHIAVHHTNEIAQSEAAYGKQLARIWMHGEFLVLDKEKMAKSGENFITLPSLASHGAQALAYRYLALGTHYRSPLSFSWSALSAAENALANLYDEVRTWAPPKIGCAEFEQHFLEAINDDLNMPKALGLVWQLIKSDYPSRAKAQSLLKFDAVLGLNIKKYLGKKVRVPDQVRKLLAAREAARVQKQWNRADELRDQMLSLGFVVDDTPQGQRVSKK